MASHTDNAGAFSVAVQGGQQYLSMPKGLEHPLATCAGRPTSDVWMRKQKVLFQQFLTTEQPSVPQLSASTVDGMFLELDDP